MTCRGRLPGVIRDYLEAYEAKDLARLLGCVADDIRFENVTNADGIVTLKGRPAFADLARQSAAAFEERRQQVRDCVVDGDRIVIEVDYEGTVAADLPNGWRAGQTIRLRGVSFFRLNDGKIVELRDFC